MGGAAEHPHRASSPLKRRASDLEPDASPSQKDDVDMIMVPESDHPEPTIDAKSSQVRAQSIDMLRNENQTYGAASSKTESGRLDEASAETTIPEIDEQIKIITTLIEAWNQEKPQEGAKAFLVSNRWMERVTSRGTEAKLKTKVDSDGEIGPIDNSDIVQQIIKDHKGKDFVQLKHGKGLDDFHLFPLDAWLIVSEWYGLMPGTLPIERFAHNTSQNGVESNIQFEFHPPVLTLHRAYGNGVLISQKLKVDRPAAPVFVLSTSTKYVDFLKMVKEAACIDIKSKVRVWLVPRLLPTQETTASVVNTATPPSSRPGSPVNGNVAAPASHNPQDSWTDLLLGVDTFLKLEKGSERYVLDLEDLSTNPKYNGSMTLAMAGIASDQNIVLDEYISKDGEWVTTWVQSKVKSGSTAIVRSGVLDKNGSNSQSNSGRNSPTPSGPMTRGRAQKYRKPSGTVGLNNLGNTCYMNSALQCVRSVEELTKYFLSGRAKEELNFDNALGNNGEVAIAYDRLLHEIYKDPSPNSVAPRNFKNVIGKYRAQFAGYGQQDSQEFLGFLLDGLQEDLSRVKKKPYIEKPDSTDEMVNNPEAIREMAAKVWDITKQRDDSVIADLFTGMYKSTLVCPTCSKVSITFDPFNNLTLQLPIHSSWKREVIFFPLHDKPISIRVDIDKNASIRVLKDFVSKRVGVPIERLLVMENHNSAFYKLHSDLMVVSEDIQPSDIIIVQEIERKPTNWPPRKVKKKKSFKTFSSNNDSEEDDLPDWDDEMAEHMIVPVLHRIEKNHYEKSQNPNTFSDQMIVGGMPFFIMVTPEEARSEETIKRKILEKVANLTTSAAFTNNDDADTSSADGADADIVLTTGSDADSSGDSKVVANSIDGEDELVDVTMKGPKSSSVLRKFNKRRPAFMNPGSQLNPDLQNMFDVCFTGDGKQTIPIGTGIINIRFKYPSIASRIPQTQQHDDNSPSQEYDAFGSPSGSESSNGTNGKTRMNDESSSSDEDEDLPALAPRVLPVRPAGPKSGVRGKLSSRKVQSPRVVEQDAPDGGPLIRLGETLIVDWRRGAWDALFTGENPDELHGMATWTKPKTLEDPDLEALQASRMLRKKNGIHLNDCLDEFGKEEILSEMDTWYCPRCKEHKRASKKFELWKTPDILIMHLKRFSSSGYRRDKVDVLVDFPIEGLDLSSRVIETEDGKQELYDLFAVDDHWGGLGGGHYTAFAKNYEDHEWYEYNDSHFTKQKDLSRIVSSSAYLLFYRRRSDVPLGGPRFLDIRGPDTSPQASDDDMSEAGEVKGLVGNSSLHGSSSALTGVGAARHQLSHGSPGEQMTTIDPSALENVPNYEGPFSLHQSIENDEGIDMGDPPPYASKWTTEGFRSLDAFPPSGYGASAMTSRADSDAASDNVNHGSSPDRESLDERLNDFNNAEAEDFIEQSPVPDMEESGVASAVGLQQDLLDSLNANAVQYPDHEFSVRAVDEESLELDDEPVTEIHLREDGDEFLKVE